VILSEESDISFPDVYSLVTARARFFRKDAKLKVAYRCFVDPDFIFSL